MNRLCQSHLGVSINTEANVKEQTWKEEQVLKSDRFGSSYLTAAQS